jgi:hypothetical protein
MSHRSPLDGIEILLIDGNNLLYRRSGGVGEQAVRGLLVELQRALPATVRAQIVLDGHPDAGTPFRQRISATLEIRHAGGTADDAIVAEVNGVPWATRGRMIVVTDNRGLADRSRTAGALHRRLDWLSALPPAPTNVPPRPGTSLGAGRPPRPARRRG